MTEKIKDKDVTHFGESVDGGVSYRVVCNSPSVSNRITTRLVEVTCEDCINIMQGKGETTHHSLDDDFKNSY